MPTKSEVRKFLTENAPGKPEIGGLFDSFWVVWDNDLLSIHLDEENSVIICHSITGKSTDEALYLSIMGFAHKIREFLTTQQP